MQKTFLLTFEHGPNYDSEKSFHDQSYWENHTRFTDKLFLEGKVSMCGSLKDESKVIVVASGTSCRHQIKDGTGKKSLHPVEVLYESLLIPGPERDQN